MTSSRRPDLVTIALGVTVAAVVAIGLLAFVVA